MSLSLQDITSLLHTIYEVVDSSVNHSPASSKTLRVKLTVAPDGSQSKRSTLLNQAGEGPRPRPIGTELTWERAGLPGLLRAAALHKWGSGESLED